MTPNDLSFPMSDESSNHSMVLTIVRISTFCHQQQYADDTQLYMEVSSDPSDPDLNNLESETSYHSRPGFYTMNWP